MTHVPPPVVTFTLYGHEVPVYKSEAEDLNRVIQTHQSKFTVFETERLIVYRKWARVSEGLPGTLPRSHVFWSENTVRIRTTENA